MHKLLFSLSAILLLSATIMFSQPNSEARLVITEPADCVNNIMYVDIEVRAASLADTFRLGGQNYRFSFDYTLVGNPQLETELELSGVVVDGTNTTSIYDVHTLTGTLANVVSYNVDYLGVGYLLTTDWVSVGRVSFDILTTQGCFDFIFFDQTTFPPTYIGALVPGIPSSISTNVGVKDLSVCIEELCTVPTEEIYEEATWEIFPNPIRHRANVKLEQNNPDNEMVKVEVMDVSGKLVYSQILSDNSFSTTSLLPGMYLVQLKTDNWQSGVEKLVKLK